MKTNKRILVIGSPGSGKTFFSNHLGKISNMEVIHLDDYYWNEDWKHSAKEDWKHTLETLVQKDSYIMDGNYLNSLKMRAEYADKIICINAGMFTCLKGYTRRTIINLLTKGSQLPEPMKKQNNVKLSEQGYFSFCRYIMDYHKKKKKNMLEMLNQLDGVEVMILTPKQAKSIIANGR